ncbi:MAG: MMPL family transporter [Desulfobacterales bacterium]|jgi:predicted RND superfamily exporter protein|nr:MMPL family transporter [Desulfobacterales bacterium]
MPGITPSKDSSDKFQQHLKEAELYLQQGLLDEARRIFSSLHQKLKEELDAAEAGQKLRPSGREKLVNSVRSLEVRLREIDQKKAAFLDSAGGPVKKIEADLTAENILQRGILLQGLGFYDEAIDEFRHAAAQQAEMVGECYEHIGLALLGKGELENGVHMLRQAIDLEADQSDSQIRIYEKIADAYESMGNKQKAIGVYRELISLDAHYARALQKIDQLSAELRRSPLELATICRYPKWFLIASILVALFFMAFIPSVKTVDNIDYFVLEQHPDTLFYNHIKSVFGNDEFFIVAFENDAVFSTQCLTAIKNITEKIESLEEVEEVISLANVEDIVGGADYFETGKFFEEIPEDASELAVLGNRATGNPLYVKNLISTDGRSAAIIVRPHDRPQDEGLRKRLVEKTEAILKPYETEIGRFYLSGGTITNLRLSQYLKKDMAIFMPATYLLITLAIWMFYRKVVLTLLAVLNISVCVGATFGLMGLTGVTENNITSIVIPLVMSLALCDTVHIFSHLDITLLDRFQNEKEALAHILNRVGLPCFLTTLTTAVGFFSLAVSEIQPIKEFAWIASAGMVFEFMFSFFFLPPLLLLFHPRRIYSAHEEGTRMTAFLKMLHAILVKYNRWVLLFSAVIVIGAIVMIPRVRVETNLIEFFKEKSPVRVALDFIEKRLAGIETMDISFKADDPDAFKYPANLLVIEKVQRYVDGLKGVDKSLSFVDFMKDMNQSFHSENPDFYRIPESLELVSQYLLLYDSEDISDYVNSSYDHARLTLRLSVHSSSAQKQLMKKISDFINETDKHGIDIRITGSTVNFIHIIEALVSSQVSSLGLATLVISVIMLIVFRSVSLAALSLVPNLFPILLNFGIMGATGIALDTGTAIIAAVALGIAVDDTIHFLSEYQRKRAQGIALPAALEDTIMQKGHAIIASSLILSLGFGVLVLSSFAPIVNFGMLCAIIMVTAMIGDIIVLPAIILLKKNRGQANNTLILLSKTKSQKKR